MPATGLPGYTRGDMAKQPVVLIIRDGWGVNPEGPEAAQSNGDATVLAQTPFHDEMLAKYPKKMPFASRK